MDTEQEHKIDFNFDAQYEQQKAAIERRELALLPEKYHHKFLPRRRGELANRVQKHVRDFRIDLIPSALSDFSANLRADAQREIATNPELRPWSPAEQIKTWANRLADLRWNGFETSALMKMLAAVGGETILEGALRYIRTDRRTITRDDLRAFAEGLRPWDKPDQKAFGRNFTPETVLQNAELAAAREKREREHPVYTSGPTRLIGTPIHN